MFEAQHIKTISASEYIDKNTTEKLKLYDSVEELIEALEADLKERSKAEPQKASTYEALKDYMHKNSLVLAYVLKMECDTRETEIVSQAYLQIDALDFIKEHAAALDERGSKDIPPPEFAAANETVLFNRNLLASAGRGLIERFKEMESGDELIELLQGTITGLGLRKREVKGVPDFEPWKNQLGAIVKFAKSKGTTVPEKEGKISKAVWQAVEYTAKNTNRLFRGFRPATSGMIRRSNVRHNWQVMHGDDMYTTGLSYKISANVLLGEEKKTARFGALSVPTNDPDTKGYNQQHMLHQHPKTLPLGLQYAIRRHGYVELS